MNTTKTPQTNPTPREIAKLAYEIWRQGGCKPGTDMENWLQAEKQLKTDLPRSLPQTDSPEPNRTATAELDITKTNHLRRATNVRLQNHLVRP
jgi:Protein of unknown function (DUF2934)